MPAEMPNALPCPFCGSNAVVHEENLIGDKVSFYVGCSNEGCCDFNEPYDTKRRAIEDWNRRATAKDGDLQTAHNSAIREIASVVRDLCDDSIRMTWHERAVLKEKVNAAIAQLQ